MFIVRSIASVSLVLGLAASSARGGAAETVHRDVPYAENPHERQVLDVYAPSGGKNLPVVFWIHGGGWQTGDKSSVQLKPRAFVDRGFVFVSTNYRLWPHVDMETLIRDVAKSAGWVHRNIARYGGDPNRMLLMGHSAGAQLAAILSTDERYLKAEGVSLKSVRGCVPVDGDTYDIPLMIDVARARRKPGDPEPKSGHFVKFGSDPAKHRNFSAINHVAAGKNIPPFLVLHVADHPDVKQQAERLGAVLKQAGLDVKVFGAPNTNHTQINADLGAAGDPSTEELYKFVDRTAKE